jgi:peptide/nickel transport system permease protein
VTALTARLPRRIGVPRLARTREGRVGIVVLVAVLLVALLGPLLAPHDPTAPIGVPGTAASSSAPLGTDFLGRDVLSRTLHGGISVIGLAGIATVGCYAIGITVGLIAGYTKSLADPLLMRVVDFVLAFPALLLLLILLTGLGTSEWVTVLGVAIVLFPGVSRIVRTATMEVSVRGYVEAAVARGERMPAILRQEILPNIVSPIMADVGIRFAGAIIFIASVNFLGLGLRPPASDWGLMVSENRQVINSNIWAVLAPALLIGLLTIAVNLIADSYARTRGRTAGSR